jgi:hypothetical protein
MNMPQLVFFTDYSSDIIDIIIGAASPGFKVVVESFDIPEEKK